MKLLHLIIDGTEVHVHILYACIHSREHVIMFHSLVCREYRDHQHASKYTRQDRDPKWLAVSDAVTSILLLRRHAITSTILSCHRGTA